MPNPLGHIGGKGDSIMQIFQLHEARLMVEAYHDGHITVSELMEEMRQYWGKKICKETKTPTVKKTGRLADARKTEV